MDFTLCDAAGCIPIFGGPDSARRISRCNHRQEFICPLSSIMSTAQRPAIYLNFKNFDNRNPVAPAWGGPSFAVCYNVSS